MSNVMREDDDDQKDDELIITEEDPTKKQIEAQGEDDDGEDQDQEDERQAKAKDPEEDEREAGKRALLNLGHTYGHAVEAVAGYGKLTHGEAVAMGIDFAVNISTALGHIARLDAERIKKLLNDWGYEESPARLDPADIKAALKHDKKVSGGDVKWVLPLKIGEARWGYTVKEEVLDAHL